MTLDLDALATTRAFSLSAFHTAALPSSSEFPASQCRNIEGHMAPKKKKSPNVKGKKPFTKKDFDGALKKVFRRSVPKPERGA